MKCLFLLFLSAASLTAQNHTIASPGKILKLGFGLTPGNRPSYRVFKGDAEAISLSSLGIVRSDGDFSSGMASVSVSAMREVRDDYALLHGKKKAVRYHANQVTWSLRGASGKRMDILFNVSDDGIAIKYRFPEEGEMQVFRITEEKTGFRFPSGARGWLQPMSKAKTGWESTNPSYEEHYLAEVSLDTPSPTGQGWVFPALVRNGDTWIAISETGLGRDYCGSHLSYDEKEEALKIAFPQPEEVFPGGILLPESSLPWETPWRIAAIGDLATVSNSTLGTDLADSAIETDTDHIRPGPASWSWAILKDDSVNYDTTKAFIDYAQNMNWRYCLVDADWDRRIGIDRIKELIVYGKERGVGLMLWYNSAGSWNTTPYTPKNRFLTPESRETEFRALREMGVVGVKIDFFGGDGQSMIAYYHDILEAAAKQGILVNFHGATLPRGWQRTYPNLMTMESVKGFEFISFFQENADKAAEHCAILPFTRNLFDPMDFTPMCLDAIPNITRRTTPAFELALPTLFLSGIQHIAETPAGMAKQPDFVLDYLKGIPTDWDESRLVSGYPGKEVVMARRRGAAWFVMGINGEGKEKLLSFDLAFIGKKKGTLITDGPSGLEHRNVTSEIASVPVKANGGFVMKFQ